MVIFNSYVSHNQRVSLQCKLHRNPSFHWVPCCLRSLRWPSAWNGCSRRRRSSHQHVPGAPRGWWILVDPGKVPSGKHTKSYGKSPFLMGKLTISMAIFNSYVKLPECKRLENPMVDVGTLAATNALCKKNHENKNGNNMIWQEKSCPFCYPYLPVPSSIKHGNRTQWLRIKSHYFVDDFLMYHLVMTHIAMENPPIFNR